MKPLQFFRIHMLHCSFLCTGARSARALVMTAPFKKLLALVNDEIKRGSIDGVAKLDGGHNVFPSRDMDMQELLDEAEEAIKLGIQPELIKAGSSGSYFVKDKDGKMIGVFKPKDEEPFAPYNPKWPKFFQRICCPCCFGRGCILENQGYVSETAASMVDDKLGFGIVPRTRIVYLTSPVFYYSKSDKNKKQLPPKCGSFQVFMHGYKDAGDVMYKWDKECMPTNIVHSFLLQFQRLVVLDYIVRNTDRSPANWLIKLTEDTEEQTNQVTIAAIDHGLCFPHKHPNDWREYPFYWTFLPIAHIPFLPQIKEEVLAFLDDVRAVETLCMQIYKLFKVDATFQAHRTRRLISVMRGQMFNLRRMLSHPDDRTPFLLAAEPRYMLTPKIRHETYVSKPGEESPPSIDRSNKFLEPWQSIKEGIGPFRWAKDTKRIASGARWEDTYYIKQVTANAWCASCGCTNF